MVKNGSFDNEIYNEKETINPCCLLNSDEAFCVNTGVLASSGKYKKTRYFSLSSHRFTQRKNEQSLLNHFVQPKNGIGRNRYVTIVVELDVAVFQRHTVE